MYNTSRLAMHSSTTFALSIEIYNKLAESIEKTFKPLILNKDLF